MVGLCEQLPSVVVEGVGEDPVGRGVGNGVTDPFDVVGELTSTSGTVVLRIYDPLDKIFGQAIDDKWRRGRLLLICEGVRVFWFEL